MSKARSNSVVFTACSVNYLSKAFAMCTSVLDHDPDLHVVVLLVDVKRPISLRDKRVTLVWAEDIGFPDYLRCAFKYNIIELNTALKPHMALTLLKRYDRVVYLDPDICVFDSLQPVLDHLDDADFLLSPHALTPYSDDRRPSDRDLLRFGSFNLGFFAARKSDAARAVLSWWDRKCQADCYYEPSMGLGVDQKWMDLAPCFFNGMKILKDPGVNVAFWNMHERFISREQDRWLVNGRHPLIFVHFSSYEPADPTSIAAKQTRYEPGSRPDFALARDVYAQRLAAVSQIVEVASLDYGYSTMSDGSVISAALRRFYAGAPPARFSDVVDPFRVPGAVDDFARKNRLYGSDSRVGHVNFKAEAEYGRQKSLINAGFRSALRILGPDRYFMLMRYLANYASILNQSELLKYK